MPADSPVPALVTRAIGGDQRAWDELVERYAPMLWSICRDYRLDRRDADDVGQHVWLLAVKNLGALRNPQSFGAWLATTTKRECSRALRARRQHESVEQPLDVAMTADEQSPTIEQTLEAAERDAALRDAFARLPPAYRRILTLLMQDVSYTEISVRLDIPIGSIGPTRARCLAKLRGDPALIALMDAGIEAGDGDRHV